MKKLIKDLKPGDTFLDSFGIPLKVMGVEPLEWLGIPRTSPKCRVSFETVAGLKMYQNYRAEREVILLGKPSDPEAA